MRWYYFVAHIFAIIFMYQQIIDRHFGDQVFNQSQQSKRSKAKGRLSLGNWQAAQWLAVGDKKQSFSWATGSLFVPNRIWWFELPETHPHWLNPFDERSISWFWLGMHRFFVNKLYSGQLCNSCAIEIKWDKNRDCCLFFCDSEHCKILWFVIVTFKSLIVRWPCSWWL